MKTVGKSVRFALKPDFIIKQEIKYCLYLFSWFGVEFSFRIKSEVPENLREVLLKKLSSILTVAEILALDYNHMKNM